MCRDVVTPSLQAPLWHLIIGCAAITGMANAGTAVVSPMIRPTFLLDIASNDLPVSLEIVSVLGLQILLSIPESRLIYRLCGTTSRAQWLVLVVCISVLLSWTTVFNIQLLLAPSFTFTTEAVVMTNPYIAVVLTYAGCIVISLGSLFGTAAFLPKTPDITDVGRPIPVLAAGIQGGIFLAVGVIVGV